MAIATGWAKVAGRFRANRYGMGLVGEKIPKGRKMIEVSPNKLIESTKKYVEEELNKLRSDK